MATILFRIKVNTISDQNLWQMQLGLIESNGCGWCILHVGIKGLRFAQQHFWNNFYEFAPS